MQASEQGEHSLKNDWTLQESMAQDSMAQDSMAQESERDLIEGPIQEPELL